MWIYGESPWSRLGTLVFPGAKCESVRGCGAGALGGVWGGVSSVLPEPVAEGGLGEGLEKVGPRDTSVATLSSPPPPLCVSEAPRFESIMEDVEVGAGETARFAVVVEGKPLPDIMWYKVRG